MSEKRVLDTSAMLDDFFSDTSIIGIASALPAYRFCSLLNKHFDLNFIREADLDICLQVNSEEQFFAIYQYILPLNGGRYLLYRLKNDKDSLLPEIKQLDYLLLIQSFSPEEDGQFILQGLRGIPDVQLAQLLTRDKLKNANSLLV